MSNLDTSGAATEGSSTQFLESISYSGDVPRNDGWLFGSDAVNECGTVRSVNTVIGDLLADAEALLAAPLGRISLDDIARQAQPNPLHPQHGAHHHV